MPSNDSNAAWRDPGPVLRHPGIRGGLQAAALSAAFALAAAAGCSQPPRTVGPAPATSPAAGSPSPAPAAGVSPEGRFVIDPAQSELRLLVFRAGALAHLGHDHVIEGHGLSGWIDPKASGARALVDLVIPVDAFEIDPDAARAEEGPEFAEQITADAKAGTRHNMLGEALLDAARFAQIEVRGIAADAAEATTAQKPPPASNDTRTRSATLAVAVAGHESRQTVTMNIVLAPDRLTASADFSLRQTALGLTPFSVMMGALQVKDEMHVHVRIVARAPRG
jgi:hypothetical protein